MTGSRLQDAIAKFAWYQRIPLGDDLATPGEDTYTLKKLPLLELPEDLSGRSVLDIGCGEGFFAFEAERRGAAPVLAVDVAPDSGAKFDLLKRHFRSRAEFRALAVDDLDPAAIGRFDLVLFLSVLQHLRHPFRALDRIAELTGWMALMEVPVAVRQGPEDIADEPLMIRRLRPGKRAHLLPNWAMLTEMLATAGFAQVQLIAMHRPREIAGYGDRFVQKRAILKAYVRH